MLMKQIDENHFHLHQKQYMEWKEIIHKQSTLFNQYIRQYFCGIFSFNSNT